MTTKHEKLGSVKIDVWRYAPHGQVFYEIKVEKRFGFAHYWKRMVSLWQLHDLEDLIAKWLGIDQETMELE